MMTLEAALARGGLRIAAWDRYANNASALRIVAVEDQRAEVIVRETVEPARRAELERRMLEHGLLLGAAYRVCKFIWVFGGTTLGVWELGDGMPLEGEGDALLLRGERIAAANVRSVVSFYDEEDYGHRGVKLELRTNTQVVVVEEHDAAAEYDPTYGWTNLQVDGGWITHLGRELAAALGVPHEDQLIDVVTPAPPGRSTPAVWERPSEYTRRVDALNRERGARAAPEHHARSAQLAKDLLAGLDTPEDPAHAAARAAHDRREEGLLEVYYVRSGQRPPIARTIAEIDFATTLTPCTHCGKRSLANPRVSGTGTLWASEATCSACNTRNQLAFATTGDIRAALHRSDELGDGPSLVIRIEQFREELARLAPAAALDPVARARALICVNEIAKLLRPGPELDEITARRAALTGS